MDANSSGTVIPEITAFTALDLEKGLQVKFYLNNNGLLGCGFRWNHVELKRSVAPWN
jgi:antitoxin component of MazEF toxin-antitoxin module